jgi:DNA-binding MarR family transcriptional regulator
MDQANHSAHPKKRSGAAASTRVPGREDDPIELANRLRPVIFQLARHLRRELHSLGITNGQASVLAAIQTTPGIGVKELSEREGLSEPSICVQIDKLENAGLVERQRDAGSDRRRVRLQLTSNGLRVLRAVRSRRTAWLAERLEKMETAQRRDINRALGALADLIPRGEPT